MKKLFNYAVCEICGRPLKRFVHNCDMTSTLKEKFGCPYHDDLCEFCTTEEELEDY